MVRSVKLALFNYGATLAAVAVVVARLSTVESINRKGSSFQSTDESGYSIGDPCRTRTCDLLLRRQLLYPVELRGHGPAQISVSRAEFY